MKLTTVTIVTAALLLVLSLPALGQPELNTFLEEQAKLQDKQIEQLKQGKVVTKVLQPPDKYGILVFGGVYVNAPIEKFADVFRHVEKLQAEKVYLNVEAFGDIGSPATEADFSELEIPSEDVDDLEKCKPGDCEIQIMNIEAAQKAIDWKSKNKYDEANKLARKRIAEAMNLYMQEGLKSFGEYRDRKKPLNIYQATAEMVDRAYYLPKDRGHEIHSHVVEYPNKKMETAEDIFYWEKIDFGQGPVIRVNHVSLFPGGAGGPAKLIATNKQLFASKYMRVALQIYACIPAEGKPGFYLIQMSDSRMPDFGGIKGSIVKKVATSKAEEGTRDTLEIFKRRSEDG